jgi:predicted MFS family arabinose efflux permease
VFAASSKPLLTRVGLVGFAIMLVAFGLLHVAGLAYLAILLLGCVYFAVITSLSTVLQEEIDDAVRGKVMALWIMGFGGTVPFGGLAGGWVIEQFGITPMIGIGAVISLVLAWWADLLPVRPRGLLAIEPTAPTALP